MCCPATVRWPLPAVGTFLAEPFVPVAGVATDDVDDVDDDGNPRFLCERRFPVVYAAWPVSWAR